MIKEKGISMLRVIHMIRLNKSEFVTTQVFRFTVKSSRLRVDELEKSRKIPFSVIPA